MKVRLLLAALLLAGVAAASVTETPVLFNDNTAIKRLSSTAACTTNWIPCQNMPYQAFYFNAFINADTAESVRVGVTFQVGIASIGGGVRLVHGFLDTVKMDCIGNLTDTLRSEAKCFGTEIYPPLSTRIRFLFTGLTGNSDSTYVDSLRLCGQTVNY